jgi:hypothetical protein
MTEEMNSFQRLAIANAHPVPSIPAFNYDGFPGHDFKSDREKVDHSCGGLSHLRDSYKQMKRSMETVLEEAGKNLAVAECLWVSNLLQKPYTTHVGRKRLTKIIDKEGDAEKFHDFLTVLIDHSIATIIHGDVPKFRSCHCHGYIYNSKYGASLLSPKEWTFLRKFIAEVGLDCRPNNLLTLVMYYQLGSTQTYIAESLGINQSTVSDRILRNSKLLKEAFNNLGSI